VCLKGYALVITQTSGSSKHTAHDAEANLSAAVIVAGKKFRKLNLG
jgi:hypothetical protein